MAMVIKAGVTTEAPHLYSFNISIQPVDMRGNVSLDKIKDELRCLIYNNDQSNANLAIWSIDPSSMMGPHIIRLQVFNNKEDIYSLKSVVTFSNHLIVNESVNIKNIIQILQILSDYPNTKDCQVEFDYRNDRKLGIEEILYLFGP
ncbi:MAG: hypothetical protein OMM_06589 [Candidatus Magnetoglobus multicellularis str. Araruama]|uniref:Uncharacterized protein n=1 Tax=Candidatus Magnetoglobus multicellularis str. Araruama TaxID=890399 RepID=A0A1V1PGJ4_9BACT|nr:MAG: hypothetical protein OMM_06589 [Candidatus Magnetoglobus multicellularis str. Araruama]